MRIAHLTWSLGIGGIQTMLVEIANRQIEAGYEVGIFVIDTYVSEYITKKLHPNIRIFYMGRIRGHKAVLPFIKLNWYLWRYDPDIIHSHAANLVKVVFSKVPKVVTIHNTNCVASHYNGYVAKYAISKAVADDYINKGGKDVKVIENGIPCDKIQKKQQTGMGSPIKIVEVSRIFFSQKGQDLLIQAAAKCRSRMKDSGESFDVEVHFVGDGLDMEKLQQMVKELDMESCTTFWGFQSQEWVHEHLRDFDLFVQPSRYEGFGLTVAEACAAKLPVLVSDVEGPAEIVEHGKLGMMFQSENIDDLADKLYEFLHNGYDSAMVEKAYQHTLDKYDVKRTVNRYLEEYRDVLESR